MQTLTSDGVHTQYKEEAEIQMQVLGGLGFCVLQTP